MTPLSGGRKLDDITADEVAAGIRIWQVDDRMHPLTCGVDSSHPPLVIRAVHDRTAGDDDQYVLLGCETCGYRQRVAVGQPLWYLMAGFNDGDIRRRTGDRSLG